ncbi:MAG: AI-2E family transporter [Clostridia bacterium]|nr:AI-2E family transporter [Clostridia bacterium]
MKNIESKWVKIVLCGIILIICYKLIDNYRGVLASLSAAAHLFLPFTAGIVIAFFTSRPSGKIEQKLAGTGRPFLKRHARVLGVLSVYLIFFAVIAFAMVFISPRLYRNAQELVANIPQYYDMVNKFISENEFLSRYASVESIGQHFLKFISMENVNRWFGIIGSVANSFLTVFMSIVISIYINLEKDQIFSFARLIKNKFFKGGFIDVAVLYGRRIIDVFYSYMSGMVIDAIAVGTVSAIALSLFKVPYAVLLGVLVAIGNMIPFFGAIISSVVLCIISLISLGPLKAVWVLIFQLVLGQLDGNLLQPRILSSSTGISPLLVLLSVLIFGDIFGVAGMILGVPVCAAIKMMILDYLDNGILDGSYGKEEEK